MGPSAGPPGAEGATDGPAPRTVARQTRGGECAGDRPRSIVCLLLGRRGARDAPASPSRGRLANAEWTPCARGARQRGRGDDPRTGARDARSAKTGERPVIKVPSREARGKPGRDAKSVVPRLRPGDRRAQRRWLARRDCVGSEMSIRRRNGSGSRHPCTKRRSLCPVVNGCALATALMKQQCVLWPLRGDGSERPRRDDRVVEGSGVARGVAVVQ